MKLCKNCKHCIRSWVSPIARRFDKCGISVEKGNFDYSRNVRQPDQLRYCSTERMDVLHRKNCGPDAKFFEAVND